MNGKIENYLLQMGLFYFFTIAIETPILMAGLSKRHPMRNRVFAGIWLTACTYPFVWLVFPALIDPAEHRGWYLLVSETFAPVAECLLFWLAFDRPYAKPSGVTEPIARRDLIRDMITVTVANFASFGIGELWSKVADWVSTLVN